MLFVCFLVRAISFIEFSYVRSLLPFGWFKELGYVLITLRIFSMLKKEFSLMISERVFQLERLIFLFWFG